MDAATAGLVGAAIGFSGNALITWINRYFDEKKARCELKLKTAFDYWQTAFQAAISKGSENVPFEAFFLHAVQIMELTERKDLSADEFIVD
jgi:hypothetical protein